MSLRFWRLDVKIPVVEYMVFFVIAKFYSFLKYTEDIKILK